mgnify:FL=1|tara:strand:+ start:158 stop:460 length:303 start_codon:yes stop_codon:yes gene_type:complete
MANAPFKMKGPSLLKMVKALKKKKGKDPYTKKDYDFLKEQKEERVTSMDYLSKTPRGPVEIENKPSRKEIEESFKIGEKLANFDTPSDILDYQMKKKKKK